MGSSYFFALLFSLSAAPTVCHSLHISVSSALCLPLSSFCSPRHALVLHPPITTISDLGLTSSSPNVSLCGGTIPPPLPYLPTTSSSPATLSLSLSLWPPSPSVYLCVPISHSPPPLSAIFFFHFSFFYLGAHSSPPTLEILTK